MSCTERLDSRSQRNRIHSTTSFHSRTRNGFCSMYVFFPLPLPTFSLTLSELRTDATFMSYLCSHRSFRNRPILILLQPHISMSFFEKAYHSPPDQVTLTKSIERMMKRLKFDEAGGATVLSHSNGTVRSRFLNISFDVVSTDRRNLSLTDRSCLVSQTCT